MSEQVAFKIEEVEEACKASLDFLAGISIPEVCSARFPDIYANIYSLLLTACSTPRDFSQFALGLPRGHAKTTFLKIVVVALLLFTKKRFIRIVCSTAGMAENFLADVAAILDSPNITKTFGNWADNRRTNKTDMKVFIFRGRKIILEGIGSGAAAARGIAVDFARPDVILMDDMQTKDESESEPASRKIMSWMVGTLMKSKAPDGCTFIYSGNMYRDIKLGGSASNLYTCILRNLQNNPEWRSIIVGALLADGSALWEDVQPKRQLLRELQNDISMGLAEVFYSEVLNDPQCGTGQHFDLSKLPPYSTDPEVDLRTGRFILIDPSLGKKKSDAQIVMEVEVWDGVPEICGIHIKQVSAPELVDWVVDLAVKTKTPLICAEAVAYQGTLLQWFSKVCKDREITNLKFEPVHPGGRKKVGRILSFFKALMEGRIRINPKCLALVLSQISIFDPLKANNTDDILDTGGYIEDVILEYTSSFIFEHFLQVEYSDIGEGVEEGNCVF